jgi:hypothetical protein
MAPEQFGGGEIDPRTDIWALGVVLYEMVCGRRPYDQREPAVLTTAIIRREPTPPSQVNSACSRELSEVIERCLNKDSAGRWPSCAELARRLEDRTLARDPRRRRTRGFTDRLAPAAALSMAMMLGALVPVRAESKPMAAHSEPAAASEIAVATAPLDRSQMEEMLRHGRIGKLRRLSVGTSGSSRTTVYWQGKSHDAHVQTIDTYLGSGSRYANQSDSYRYNIAAYRLDRLIGLGMVPVSVERATSRGQAALTWWVDDVEMMELERRKLGRKPPDARSWNLQMQRATVFQELVANSDCNQTNHLITRDWKIWLIDFTRAFRTHRKLTGPRYLRRLDPGLREALARLDESSLRREVKGLLNTAQIRSILARRDSIVGHFESKAAPASA